MITPVQVVKDFNHFGFSGRTGVRRGRARHLYTIGCDPRVVQTAFGGVQPYRHLDGCRKIVVVEGEVHHHITVFDRMKAPPKDRLAGMKVLSGDVRKPNRITERYLQAYKR